MKRMSMLSLVAVLALFGTLIAAEKTVPAALNFKMNRLNGEAAELKDYEGKVVLMVNVASKCGLTPQYKQLEELHEKYGKEGLAILAFPANEFGKQEPGTSAEISDFCTSKYGVEFDMFEKVVVKGEGICPLYKFLTEKETNPEFAGEIKWNFEKFVLNRKGEVVARFDPRTKPDAPEVLEVIEKELAAK